MQAVQWIPGVLLAIAGAVVAEPFRITVIDAETGRGVPLVELTTTNDHTFITDSAGVIAFDEPGLMDQRVFFTVASHGYEFPADGFNMRGRAVNVTPGGSVVFEISRLNIAERLYRMTGQGIYVHSVRLGDTPPTENPVLNGEVMGQDSIQNAIYGGTLFWFWGDTGRPAYPLGNFHMSGAISKLPSQGGLDPDIGVNLDYFINDDGFSRRMAPMDKPGPVWLDGFMVLPDRSGHESMVAHYARVKTLGELHEQGLMRYNDDREIFEPIKQIELGEQRLAHGHPFRVDDDGIEYFYFPSPFPSLRVRADYDAILDPEQYEAFTCVVDTDVVRDSEGRVEYAWRPGEHPLRAPELNRLVQAGELAKDESWIQFRDVETGKEIWGHGGSIYWNKHRRRWIMIALQTFGEPSFLGEIWYAEGDTPIGPWVYARRVVTHDNYSFYNPKQHAYFDQDGGRIIYFEGTYTAMFADDPDPTPRYNYNQIMYRLDLDDPRLALPAPIYSWPGADGRIRYGSREAVERLGVADRVMDIPFFAIPPGRPIAPEARLVPVTCRETDAGDFVFARAADAEETIFYAAAPAGEGETPDMESLYQDGVMIEPSRPSNEPIARVWKNPYDSSVTQAIVGEAGKPIR